MIIVNCLFSFTTYNLHINYDYNSLYLDMGIDLLSRRHGNLELRPIQQELLV